MRSASATDVPPNFITTVPDTLGSLGVVGYAAVERPCNSRPTRGLSLHLDDWTTCWRAGSGAPCAAHGYGPQEAVGGFDDQHEDVVPGGRFGRRAGARPRGWAAQAQQTGQPGRRSLQRRTIAGNPVVGTTLSAPAAAAGSSPNPEADRTEAGGSGGAARAPTELWRLLTSGRATRPTASRAGDIGRVRRSWRATCAGSTRATRRPGRRPRRSQYRELSAPVGPVRAAPTPSRRPCPTAGADARARPRRPRPSRRSTPSRGHAGADAAARSCRRPRARAGSSGRSRSCACAAADRHAAPSVPVLSVRAPRAAKISVRCKGRSCPASRWSRSAAQEPADADGTLRARPARRGQDHGVRDTPAATSASAPRS